MKISNKKIKVCIIYVKSKKQRPQVMHLGPHVVQLGPSGNAPEAPSSAPGAPSSAVGNYDNITQLYKL